jgi:hypothetical protein
MPDTIFTRNAQLRADLQALLRRDVQTGKPVAAAPRPPEKPDLRFESASVWDASAESNGYIDVIVTMNEINDRHGTGPLVKRIFAGRQGIFSIRSRDDWGIHDFGDWQAKISHEGRSRSECFRTVLGLLGGKRVRHVVCVPFLQDELLTSIAIKEAFNAILCVYLMDDQNIAANVIPDGLMREFLEKCSLRLVTHPELRLAYERKYKLPFYILPAVVPDQLVIREPQALNHAPLERSGALLGSFWDQSWFDRLCRELSNCPCQIDWYGNNKSPWLQFPEENLKAAGIRPRGLIPETQLAVVLRQYPFVMVPVSALDEQEKNKGVASLSLPGRILFAAATSHTPMLIIGSEQTCGSRFVRHFGIGVTAPYENARIAAAIDHLKDPGIQLEMRQNAARVAAAFSDRGVVEWLTASIEKGCPADNRFEDAFAGYNAYRDPSCFSVSCGR